MPLITTNYLDVFILTNYIYKSLLCSSHNLIHQPLTGIIHNYQSCLSSLQSTEQQTV